MKGLSRCWPTFVSCDLRSDSGVQALNCLKLLFSLYYSHFLALVSSECFSHSVLNCDALGDTMMKVVKWFSRSIHLALGMCTDRPPQLPCGSQIVHVSILGVYVDCVSCEVHYCFRLVSVRQSWRD